MSNSKKCITVKISNCIQKTINFITGATPANNVISQPAADVTNSDTPLTYAQYRSSVKLSGFIVNGQRKAKTSTPLQEDLSRVITDPLLYSLTNGQYGYTYYTGNDDTNSLLVTA